MSKRKSITIISLMIFLLTGITLLIFNNYGQDDTKINHNQDKIINDIKNDINKPFQSNKSIEINDIGIKKNTINEILNSNINYELKLKQIEELNKK